MRPGRETRKTSFCKTNGTFATWLNTKASLEIPKRKLHAALRLGSKPRMSLAQL